MEVDEELFTQINALKGEYLGLPKLQGDIWVFGGHLKRPSLLLEIGSHWAWLSWGEKQIESTGLNPGSIAMSFLPFSGDDFTIEEISWNRGSHFKIVTYGKCSLEVTPDNTFGPSGEKAQPLKVRLTKEGKEIYSDWNNWP